MSNHFTLELDLKGLADVMQGMQAFGALSSTLNMAGSVGGSLVSGVGKLGLAVGVAATGALAFAQAAKQAKEELISFAGLRDQLGTSSPHAAMLRTLGAGLGAGDAGSAAAGLHAASLSGLGFMTASRYGLPYRPFELGGATDRGEMLFTALSGLRQTAQTQGMSQAIADARNLNLENWIGVVYLMDEQFEKLKADAQSAAGIFSEERVRQAYQLNMATANLSQAWGELTTVLGTLAMPAIEGLTDLLTTGARKLAAFGIGPGDAVNQELGTALRQNTEAVRQNTNMLRQLPGITGGGPNARTAIPGAYSPPNGMFLEETLKKFGRLQFGAYSVHP